MSAAGVWEKPNRLLFSLVHDTPIQYCTQKHSSRSTKIKINVAQNFVNITVVSARIAWYDFQMKWSATH